MSDWTSGPGEGQPEAPQSGRAPGGRQTLSLSMGLGAPSKAEVSVVKLVMSLWGEHQTLH